MANKKKRVILVLVIAVLVLGGAATVYLLKGAPANTVESGDDQILTLEVKEGTVAVRVEGPSVVEPYRSQDIRSQTSGMVLFAPVAGDEFSAGEVIIKIDNTDQINVTRQAELNVEQAQLDLRKTELAAAAAKADLTEKEGLLQNGAVSRDQVTGAKEAVENSDLALSGAKLKVGQTELLLEKAQAELAGTQITAPFDGIALKSSVNTGDLVNSGALLLTFADVSKVRLQAEVDEFDIGKIRPGMSVTVTADALGDESMKSKVERVSPSAEVINNISIFSVSTVLSNSDFQLRPGMSADLSILISSDKGIVVPSKIVSTVRDRSYIKVYENDEVVTKRVTVGADDGVNTAVLDGLEAGSVVVLPAAAVFTLSSVQTSTGTSIVPITVPGTGGSK
ncbi:MAG: efflux RND transporter periplasmic adaptor subunit [Spirochaetales bacterium]|jgi:HlyD family secretion protein|nr:efflux RND transporter periplasmic adaptor subunit [Spirochaetales bacterium]